MADIFQIVENNGTPKSIGDSKARANIAENFNTNKNYIIGEECLYEGNLYRFITNHNAGSWNNSHVTNINLANDKVNKSGDAMTGHLNFKSSTIGGSGDADSSTYVNSDHIYLSDKNNDVRTYFQQVDSSNGQGFSLGTQRVVNGSTIINALLLRIKANGDKHVKVEAPSEWRDALGLGDSSTQSLPRNTSVISSAYMYYRKIGKVVHVYGNGIQFISSVTDSSAHTIATLPSGYRPAAVTYGVWGNPTLGCGLLAILNTGEINLYKPSGISITSSSQLNFGVTFLTA